MYILLLVVEFDSKNNQLLTQCGFKKKEIRITLLKIGVSIFKTLHNQRPFWRYLNTEC